MPFRHASLPANSLAYRHRRSSLIAEDIQAMIADGRLKVGDKLPTEAMLCNQYKVSRTTLREAIQMLRTKNLLDVTPGRGSFVCAPNRQQWMADLAIACGKDTLDPSYIRPLRVLLQRHVLAALREVAEHHRMSLSHFNLKPHMTAEDNLQQETAWLTSMARLAGNPLQTMLVECLAYLDEAASLQRLRQGLVKAIPQQMTINGAIIRGSWDQAERALWVYLAGDMAPAMPALAKTSNDTEETAPQDGNSSYYFLK